MNEANNVKTETKPVNEVTWMVMPDGMLVTREEYMQWRESERN